MPGTFFGLEIARRGINVHRAALDITGHNIANANTRGYSRQQAVIEASEPWTLPDLATKMQPGQLGTGVQSEEVRRVRDSYLDVQYRRSGSLEGYWEQKLDIAQKIETVFPEPDGHGIQASMLEFFNNWHDLNNDPQDPGVKAVVKESGDELAATIRQTYSQLKGINDNTISAMGDQVDQVNHLLTQIAVVSNTIVFTVQNGAQPNDLLDQRDKLLDQLAQMGNINVVVNFDANGKATGGIDVNFIDNTAGPVLKFDAVTGKVIASKLTLITGAGAGLNENHLSIDGVDAINLTDLAVAPLDAAKGAILGNESGRLENNSLLNKLDNLAAAIIDNVNDKSGLDGSLAASGVTFFDGADAANMTINDTIKANPGLILGENALLVAQLQSTPLQIDPASSATTTLEKYYQGIVAQVGASVDKAGDMLANQQAVSQQIDSLKQSVSGVSLDEELTLAMQFQYGYQASARMLSMQDQLLDYLINRML